MDYKSIPIFKATIPDDECGMLAISLVDYPAVERDFIAFAAAEKARPVMYSVQDDEKHLVAGVVMRADFPIYRRDESGFEYYIVYDKETIRKMAEKYLVENRQNVVDLNHDGEYVEGVHLVQYYIKDAARGVNPAGFEDIEDGSLFGEFHIENAEVWEQVKAGTYRGFSLEGVFGMQDTGSTILTQARALLNKCKQLRNNNMGKFKDIMAQFGKMLAAFGQVNTDKGVLAWEGDEDLREGDAVNTINEAGEQTPAADGEYVTEDNKVIVVVDGKVSEIRDAEAEVAPEVEAAAETAEQEEVAAAEDDAAPAAEGEPDADDALSERVAGIESRVAELEAAVERMAEVVGMMNENLAKIAKEPAAAPASEQFKAEQRKAEVGESYLSRILAARKK